MWTTPGEVGNFEVEGEIYGTNIKLNETMRQIRHFFLNFETTIETEDDLITEKPYLVKFSELER